MKTIYRSLVLGILMTVFAAAATTTGYAQEVCAEKEQIAALDKEYRDNFDKDIAKQEIAVKAGKQLIEKYGACPTVDKDFVQYLKDTIPGIEEGIIKAKNDAEAKKKAAERKVLLTKFDTAAKAKNTSEIYKSGKEILAKDAGFLTEAEFLDVSIALASAGFTQSLATPPVDTYNADTINYAKSLIEKIEAGKMPKNYGVLSYTLKDPKYTDTKSYALGALNYMVGYITYYRQGATSPEKKKEALSYFYKAVQYNSFGKTEPLVYQSFGAWYLDEALRIDKERVAAIKAAGGKDTPETLAMFALSKGYADRSIDAYARAYKLAKADKAQPKDYTDSLYSRLKDLYAFRYDGKVEGIDTFVASVQNKPMPDPTTPIEPVKEEAPATKPVTTTSTTDTKPATTTTTPATTPTKPVSVTTTTTTTTKPVATTTVSTTTKTKPVKKPAPKKRGTR
jgi:hypothetical protein